MFYTEVIDKILLHQMFKGIPCVCSATDTGATAKTYEKRVGY